ncbi:YiiX family permuted papain-like enzyme [Flavobacterium hungaricum]|uniref:YiiX family permuted papain-like enzyme n=1 Tax=Flavobacterium hungaricum TaxID=2082725 RepID=A0ABR9TGX5_9FLAO|nr:YiiX family permuted papain-like enzyme [Flavobacterium hungaricum]MBE8724089.1 YiiX family permuted papain-like enzyme [Flavobacterium hungaricum]
MKTKYLFPITTFILSFGCALFVAIKVFPNNPFTGNKVEANAASNIKEGDLIFQTSESKQCEAVRIATNSKFSHCGIIFKENGRWMVFEAVQPVKTTPLEQWIQHGRDSKYVIKRLKDTSALTTDALLKMKNYGKSLVGKEYDAYFEWTDNRIYCSELIWKVYKNGAGIELCQTKLLKDFNLTDPRIQPILQERYGNEIPLDEKVVAPSDLADSNLLKTITDTY